MDDAEHARLERFSDRAERLRRAARDDLAALPPEVAHFIRVESAQGLIDNGGYRLFFERDWKDKPPYQTFVDAYAAIGCKDQAAELARVVESFGIDDPHLNPKAREAFVEQHYDEDRLTVPNWGDALCGDESVWCALLAYAERHSTRFERDR
ncbi:MAG: DUF4375 domain-containing protein [Planctomycetota bacterium]